MIQYKTKAHRDYSTCRKGDVISLHKRKAFWIYILYKLFLKCRNKNNYLQHNLKQIAVL